MVIHVYKRPAIQHSKRYDSSRSPKVAATFVRAKAREARTRNVEHRSKSAIKRYGMQTLDKSLISHQFYDPLSWMLLFLDGTDE